MSGGAPSPFSGRFGLATTLPRMSNDDTTGPRGLGLAFDPAREPSRPRDAATVLLVREGGAGVEVFCVVRHQKSSFLGGAVVFPGGKVDPADADPAWERRCSGLDPRALGFASSEGHARALAVAAGRETLEEAGVLPLAAPASAEVVAELRGALAAGRPLADLLDERSLTLDTGSFAPFARWITPEAEPRRFDARFYLVPVPADQQASNDGHETTAGFWATPRAVLERFERGEIQLAPPTTRCLELLQGAWSLDMALAVAREQSLEPVCPRFVPGDPPALVLPGDPAHEVPSRRVDGPTRFVLRDGRFVSEEP